MFLFGNMFFYLEVEDRNDDISQDLRSGVILKFSNLRYTGAIEAYRLPNVKIFSFFYQNTW